MLISRKFLFDWLKNLYRIEVMEIYKKNFAEIFLVTLQKSTKDKKCQENKNILSNFDTENFLIKIFQKRIDVRFLSIFYYQIALEYLNGLAL